MDETFDVVIVGAGIIGASVAYHLAARGCTRVLVIERSAGPGEGSTGRATGGFRAQFGTSVNVRLSLLARAKLGHFAAELGVDPGYQPCGYLFLARHQAELDALLAAQAVQHAAGLSEAQPIDQADIARLNPAVQADQLLGGVFCPSDGLIRPLAILRGYSEAASRLGVQFRYSTPCSGLTLASDRIAAVHTPSATIPTGVLVNAAGAWAAQLGQLAGLTLPISPLRRQVAITEPTSLLPEDMPLTIFTEDGFHLRVRDGRVLLLWPDQPTSIDPFDTQVEPGWLAEIARRTQARLPSLAGVALDQAGCWAGLYEMSPDQHALLGPAPGLPNLYLANGSSGHGVMHAPALGQLLAEIILDGQAHTLDVQALRPSRFAEGQPYPAAMVL